MKYCLSVCLLFASAIIFAQETQWASKVIDFSNQLSDYEYAASQVLGPPNVLPNPGDNPNAWLPNKPDKISFIKVGFDTPMRIQQLAIAESYNPGAVYEIYLYDESDKEYLLHQFNPRPISIKGRLLNVYIGTTVYPVSAVKVVIDGSKVPGYNAIDAIGISGSRMPIRAEKEEALRKNPGLEGEEINLVRQKEVSDSRPLFLPSQNALFFTRSFSPENVGETLDYGDVWMADYNIANNSFGVPLRISDNINNVGFNTVNIISDDLNSLLIGNISGKINKEKVNVAIVKKDGNEWRNISEQKIKNAQIASYNADYALIENGTVLLISTERFDTEGGRDLYVSFKEGEDKWSEPKNMGNDINTAHNEYSPFYSEDEKSLYFSTAGYSGYGEGDIFRVVKLDDSWLSWSAPENIGGDINTAQDEKYFSFDENGKYAYFSRSDPDSVYHIVKIERPKFFEKTPMVVLKGKVTDEKNNPVSASISINILPDELSYGVIFSSAESGEYQFELPSGNQFHLISEAIGYMQSDVSISLANKNQAYGYELDIKLKAASVATAVVAVNKEQKQETNPPVNPGDKVVQQDQKPVVERKQPVTVDEVLFAFDSDQPETESFPLLDRIVAFLKERKDINVEVAGFTDHIGNELFNNALAKRRALSVKKYLVENGIAASRIRAIGFGEKMPVIMGNDNQDLRVNRRVEFNFTKY